MTPLQLERFRQRAEADGTYYNGCSAIKRVGNDIDISGAVVFVDNCPSYQGSFAMFNCADALPAKPVGGGNGLSAPCINSKATPGLLIWHCGRVEMTGNGNGTFIGIMYFANNSDQPTTGACGAMNPKQLGATPPDCGGNKNSPENVFASSGGFGIWGAVAIDGNGCLYAGSNGMQVQYDYNVFNSVASYGTVGLVQDTWRELY
jgi:hypothetical protein